jgi:hypothetical protein
MTQPTPEHREAARHPAPARRAVMHPRSALHRLKSEFLAELTKC